jgi:hypothetical protein
MNNVRLTQRPPRTVDDCFDLILAIRKDVDRHHELHLAEFALIKNALREMAKGIVRSESEMVKTPPSDTHETSLVESCFDPAMPAPEVLPTLLTSRSLL